jgi:predicted RecB family endonuclease
MLGTEKIESLAESIKELAIVAKKVSDDKKVGVDDLVHVIALLPKLPKIIDSIKDLGEAVDEAKDLEVAEIISLIQAIHSKIKEIEKA